MMYGQKDKKTKKDKRTKRKRKKRQKYKKTNTKKSVWYCDVRAVSHSCDVLFLHRDNEDDGKGAILLLLVYSISLWHWQPCWYFCNIVDIGNISNIGKIGSINFFFDLLIFVIKISKNGFVTWLWLSVISYFSSGILGGMYWYRPWPLNNTK